MQVDVTYKLTDEERPYDVERVRQTSVMRPGRGAVVGGGDDGHVGQPSTQQAHQGRAVRHARVNSEQHQRDGVRRGRSPRGRRRGEDVELPERPVPGQSAREHRLDVGADVLGGLGGGRWRGEHVVGQVEPAVDDPRVTAAARPTNQLLGEARVRNLGRIRRRCRLQRVSARRGQSVVYTTQQIRSRESIQLR